MARSQKLVWVEVNRDHTPDVAERFHVQAYPSLLILGDADENVHRFAGFKPPAEFLRELDEGLRRFALYRAGSDWSEPAPRAPSLTEAARISTWKAPLREPGHGIAFVDDRMFVAQGERLYALKSPAGEVAYAIDLPQLVTDLASDGRLIYAVSYGWSHGDPIHVIDPGERRIVRTIVTEANRSSPESSAYGIAWRDGRLHVLARSNQIHEVDPETGAVGRILTAPRKRLSGLEWDGHAFVSADDQGLIFLDLEGKVVRTLPASYPLRTVGFHAGHYFAMEQPVFGFDRHHEPIMVWPKEMVVYDLEPSEAK